MMYEFKENDKVKIVLKAPYTYDEIRENGCHPDIDQRTGTVTDIGTLWTGEKSYTIKLDSILMPHPLHKNTEFDEPFDEYVETAEALELL